MLGTFDKTKYKKITKQLSQAEIADKLTEVYGIRTSLGAVKNWTRSTTNSAGKVYQPELETLKALADMFNCSIQDFFSDAEEKRQQITIEELSKSPQKYSQSISQVAKSTLSENTQRLLRSFDQLDEKEQEKIISEVEAIANEKLAF